MVKEVKSVKGEISSLDSMENEIGETRKTVNELAPAFMYKQLLGLAQDCTRQL
ncbi:MAG: hypothetical protein NOU37_08530 [Candidatus Brocadiales bacterium]|nr:hypothetical protein [Candidatus Bathyanammoxibius amoris]